MEKFLSSHIERENSVTELEIDNSTDFKDFNVKQTFEGEERNLTISYSQSGNCVINNVILYKKELELLKEFLNQRV